MATGPSPAQWTAEGLLAAVQQLPPPELTKFMGQLAEWQGQNFQQTSEEKTLLATIEENSRLPNAEQRRFNRLRQKCARGTLTESEHTEYLSLLQQLEARNVKRVEALFELAKWRGTTLRGVMQQLSLGDNSDVI